MRIEIGPRDLASQSAVVVQRVGGTGKEQVRLEELTSHLQTRLAAYNSFLLERARDFARSHTYVANDWQGFVEAVTTGFARSFHCGRQACEDEPTERPGVTRAPSQTPSCSISAVTRKCRSSESTRPM